MALLSRDPTKPGVSVDINVSYCSAPKVGSMLDIEGRCDELWRLHMTPRRVLKLGRSLGFTEVSIHSDGLHNPHTACVLRCYLGKLVATGRHTKAFPKKD